MVYVDIHGDTGRTLLNYVHNKDSYRDRVVYVSSAINREAGTPETYTAIINPFKVPEQSVEAKAIYSNEIADALTELLESASNSYNAVSVNMSLLLRAAIFTVMCSDSPSLETLCRMFLDRDGQNADLLELGRNSPIHMYRQFFQYDWDSPQLNITKAAVRNKLLYFMADPMLSLMLNGKSTVNLEQCLQDGKVIIFNLPQAAGKFTSGVVSRLCIAFINAILLRREGIDMKHRKPCYLYLDEYQEIVTKSLIGSLSGCRKFGLHCILATQATSSLSKDVKNASMVNAGIKMVGLLDHAGKVEFSKELDVPMETLNKLQPMQFMVKKNDGKHTAFKFQVPILGRRYSLSKPEQKALMDYLVYQSGIYVKAPLESPAPPAPPSAVSQTQHTERKESGKKQDKPGKSKRSTERITSTIMTVIHLDCSHHFNTKK